jgi:hypothetical protein
MKYIVFWEFDQEDGPKVTETASKLRKAMKKDPDKYSKILFPSHLMVGERKGFYVVESTAQQMMNTVLFYRGSMKFKYVPIVKASEMAEAAQQMRG